MQVAYDAGVPIVDCLYLSNLTLTNFTLQDKISSVFQHQKFTISQVLIPQANSNDQSSNFCKTSLAISTQDLSIINGN